MIEAIARALLARNLGVEMLPADWQEGAPHTTRHYIGLATAALDAIAPVVEWQPIETAPRDGTPLDLWCVDQYDNCSNRILDMSWSDGQWQDNEGDTLGDYDLPDNAPRFWRLSPNPPEAS